MNRLSRRIARLALCGVLAVAAFGCSSDAEKVKEHLAEADRYESEGDYRSAIVELKSALSLQPKNAQLNRRIGETYTAMGRPARAAFFFGEAYRLDPSQTDSALRQAPALFGTDLDAAEALVEEVLEKEPENSDAHATLAEVKLMRVDTEGALRSAFTAIELDPRSLRARRLLTLVHRARLREEKLKDRVPDDSIYKAALAAAADAGRLAQELESEDAWYDPMEQSRIYAEWEGHGKEAQEKVREAFALAVQADSTIGQRTLIREARRLGALEPDLEFRRWVYERWVEVEPDSVQAWRLLAVLTEQMDGSDRHVWRRALKERDADPELYAAYIRLLIDRARLRRAEIYLGKMPEKIRNTVQIAAIEVELAMAKDDDAEIEAALKRMREKYPEDPLARILHAAYDLQRGNAERALQDLRILSGEVERADVYRLLAAAEIRRGNRDAALAAIERSIELAPTASPTAHETRLQLLAASGDWQAVLRGMREMRRLDLPPPGESALTLRIQALYETGHTEIARRILNEALKVDDPSREVIFLFLRYEGHRQPERAEKLLRTALKADPDDRALTAALVRVELRTGKPEEALARMDSYEDRTGESAGRILHARLLLSQGRTEEAQKAVLSAFNTRPRPFGASPMLVEIYSALGKTDEAITVLEQARAEGDLRPAGLWQLGRLHYAKGDLEAALPPLEEAHKRNPSFDPAISDLALVLADLGQDLDRAVTLARRMKSRHPENSAIADVLGYVYLRKGLAEPAAFEFQSAIELERVRGNEVADYYYHLGLALRAQGRTAEAGQAFAETLRIQPEHQAAQQARAQVQDSGAS